VDFNAVTDAAEGRHDGREARRQITVE